MYKKLLCILTAFVAVFVLQMNVLACEGADCAEHHGQHRNVIYTICGTLPPDIIAHIEWLLVNTIDIEYEYAVLPELPAIEFEWNEECFLTEAERALIMFMMIDMFENSDMFLEHQYGEIIEIGNINLGRSSTCNDQGRLCTFRTVGSATWCNGPTGGGGRHMHVTYDLLLCTRCGAAGRTRVSSTIVDSCRSCL